MQHFASDNYAGICPEAMQALLAANTGHAPAYGDDEWTQRVSDRLRAVFETDCDVYLPSTALPPIRWRWPRCARATTASSATSWRM